MHAGRDTWILRDDYHTAGAEHERAIERLVRDVVGVTVRWFGTVGALPSADILLEDAMRYLDGDRAPLLARVRAEARPRSERR